MMFFEYNFYAVVFVVLTYILLYGLSGKDLFEKYLDQEGCSAQLNFIWACEGLKATGNLLVISPNTQIILVVCI